MPEPQSENPPKNQLTKDAPPWEDPTRRRSFADALRRGDTEGVIGAFYGRSDALIDTGTKRMAEYIVELRRQNVAVLGAADVFVRKTASGDLQQVIQPVRLSLDDGSLYQIPDRWEKRLRDDLNVVWNWKAHKDKPYTNVPIVNEPHKAHVSAEGYLRMNGVAGCSVGMPPTVVVDGRPQSNPYIFRDANNDVRRIVISVAVAGPAPTTGNLVIVQYVLDLDPRIDLLHMLAGVLRGYTKDKWVDGRKVEPDDDQDDDDAEKRTKRAVQLMTREAFNEFRQALDADEKTKGTGSRWTWEQLTGNVGYAHDLTNREVQGCYAKFLDLAQNLVKKAITVAKRNAMKSHPALARQHVFVGQGREATVAVVGWTSSGVDLDRYTEALDRVARGERAQGIDVIVAGDSYDPEEHRTGDAEVDVPDHPDDEQTPSGTNERDMLLAEIDTWSLSGKPERLREVTGYPPAADASVQDLRELLERLRAGG